MKEIYQEGRSYKRSRRHQDEDDDLTPEEKAERVENALLAKEVAKERQRSQGITDQQAEDAVDAWLRANGSADLVDEKKEIEGTND